MSSTADEFSAIALRPRGDSGTVIIRKIVAGNKPGIWMILAKHTNIQVGGKMAGETGVETH